MNVGDRVKWRHCSSEIVMADMPEYERCEHGARLGLDACDECSREAAWIHLRRVWKERNDLLLKLDEYERREKLHMDRIVALEQQNEALASRLDSAENAMREVVSHLQRSERGSTHWAGCPDVHPVCKAIDMLVDALPLRDSPAGPVS